MEVVDFLMVETEHLEPPNDHQHTNSILIFLFVFHFQMILS